MPPKRTDIDTDDLIVLYETGQSAANIGKQFGISGQTVRDRLIGAGVRLRTPADVARAQRFPLDDAEVARRYGDGQSMDAIAAHLGTSARTIRKSLVNSGVTIRAVSENSGRRISVDMDSVVAQFAEGIPLDDIATFHGIKQPTLRKRLAELGIPIRESLEQRRVMLDAKSVVRRYLAGESEQSLALAYSVSRSVIRRQLIGSGITPRNRSDAMFTRMANTSQDERLRLATAAHNAVRGVKRPESELEARARSWQRLEHRTSPLEPQFGEMLSVRGIKTIPQLAVGRYNLDLAAWPVTIEIHHTPCHPMTANGGRLVERTMYLADRGWRTLFVWVNPRATVKFTDLCADEVVSLLNLAETDPSAFGEYRVVRGTGQDATGLHRDRYQRPDVGGPD